ncbi:hypothetical protein NPIL_510711 [Nephila pilipes]|uniref:Uncharacterized protein n=1 Tax=Nephila pilipes TaxID=299642 RepID=A0A8X6PF91_NEPPI|nr:hypothetical protein NPIL_510711 [Nephila pilipes]
MSSARLMVLILESRVKFDGNHHRAISDLHPIDVDHFENLQKNVLDIEVHQAIGVFQQLFAWFDLVC